MIDTEKRDIHHRKQQYQSALRNLQKDQSIIKHNKNLILKFLRDCRLGKTLKNRQKKSIGVARCSKYLYILKKLSSWFDKPFDEVNQDDMEMIIENLENDIYSYQIKDGSGQVIKTKKMSHSTKVDYKKTLRKFYKWLLGDNDHYPELVDWIDTYDIINETPALRREDIEKIADAAKLRDKAIIMTLFDSGARVGELLNIRVGDLTRVDDIFKVRIKFSKTKPRTIHLPIASKYIDMWLNLSKNKNEKDFLFPLTYEALRRMLHRAGKRILNKRVYPHLMRHSSATYYANLLNHQQLCYRYGWSMASKMPNRYLDREGIFEEKIPQIVKTDEVSKLEQENQKLKEELSFINQSNDTFGKQLNELNTKYNRLFDGKEFISLLSSIMKKNSPNQVNTDI